MEEEDKKPTYTSKKPVYMGTFYKYKEEVNSKFIQTNTVIAKNQRIMVYGFIICLTVIILSEIIVYIWVTN